MGVKEGLITLLAGSHGQLYSRIHHYNGSLDKPWLLLFLFFPLSIVSSIWFFMDWIEPGEGSDPVDEWMYILPVSSVIFSFIFWNLCDTSDFISTPLILIFQIVTFAASRIIRKTKDCADTENLSYGRSVHVGIISSLVAIAINIGTMILSFVPFIGLIFMAWGFVGYIPGLDIGILSALINIYLNMEANSFKSKQKEMCKEQKSIFHWETWVLLTVAMVISIAINLLPF